MADVELIETVLERGERILTRAETRDAVLVATERRLAIVAADRMALNVPYPKLRRIQFDIERQRPATLVIVPESPSDEPQVISVRAEEYAPVAEVLVIAGRFLHETATDKD